MPTIREVAEKAVAAALDKEGFDVKNPKILKMMADLWLQGHTIGADFGTNVIITGIGSIFTSVAIRVGDAKTLSSLSKARDFLIEELKLVREVTLKKCREDPAAVDDLMNNVLANVKIKKDGRESQ